MTVYQMHDSPFSVELGSCRLDYIEGKYVNNKKQWLEENFGPSGSGWKIVSTAKPIGVNCMVYNSFVAFATEAAAVHFKLRWK